MLQPGSGPSAPPPVVILALVPQRAPPSDSCLWRPAAPGLHPLFSHRVSGCPWAASGALRCCAASPAGPERLAELRLFVTIRFIRFAHQICDVRSGGGHIYIFT